ncbi:hypothetical protein Ddc_04648 [Ditylenchus destructor]|nr:hypothetical protein Ddc_04648 [Ditylenchus destructor]
MPRIKQLGKRAQTKEDRLRERRERALERNQLDLVKEKQEREKLYLDEGASESGTSNDDTDTEEFFNADNRVKQNPEKDPPKGSDQSSEKDDEQEEELEDDDEIDDGEDYEDFNIPDDVEDEEDDAIDELDDELDLPEDIDETVDNPESEDESPQEVSSKRPVDLQENESNSDDNTDTRTETAKKYKPKKKKRKIVSSEHAHEYGVIELKTDDDRSIKVVALDKVGPSKFLNPKVNFREELLRLSTEGSRVNKRVNQAHAEKWSKIY